MSKMPAIENKTVGDVLGDPILVQQLIDSLGHLAKLHLWLRHVKHMGMYAQMREQGLSDEEARAVAWGRYPMSVWDAVYFQWKASKWAVR